MYLLACLLPDFTNYITVVPLWFFLVHDSHHGTVQALALLRCDDGQDKLLRWLPGTDLMGPASISWARWKAHCTNHHGRQSDQKKSEKLFHISATCLSLSFLSSPSNGNWQPRAMFLYLMIEKFTTKVMFYSFVLYTSLSLRIVVF